MEKKQWNENWEVGQIVATDYATARVFAGYGIDFCCHGEVALEKACEQAGVSVAEVLKALDALEPNKEVAGGFAAWPLDLLIDYVLKIHHRYIRRQGPVTLALLEKVEAVHGEAHPELHELHVLFVESLQELEMHLQKEENVPLPAGTVRRFRTGPLHRTDALRNGSESDSGDADGTRGRRKPLSPYR